MRVDNLKLLAGLNESRRRPKNCKFGTQVQTSWSIVFGVPKKCSFQLDYKGTTRKWKDAISRQCLSYRNCRRKQMLAINLRLHNGIFYIRVILKTTDGSLLQADRKGNIVSYLTKYKTFTTVTYQWRANSCFLYLSDCKLCQVWLSTFHSVLCKVVHGQYVI